MRKFVRRPACAPAPRLSMSHASGMRPMMADTSERG